jgi:hypothetical protein
MNIQTTMDNLFITKVRFEELANALAERGHQMAAAELQRELEKISKQLMQLEHVLKVYQVDIAAAQLGAK